MPAENPTEPQLQVAPFQLRPFLGGSFEYLQRSDTINGVQSDYQSLILALNAGADVNTFIWQPWFAQVNGGVTLNTYLSDNRYFSGPSANSDSQLTNNVLTGKIGMDVVPLSRYPFRTYFEKEDNRQNIGFTSASTSAKTTRFGMNQQYRTLSGLTNYTADYQQNSWEGAFFGESTQERLGLEMRTVISANNDLTVNATRDHNKAPTINQSLLNSFLYADHHYRPAASVSVHNMLNVGKSNIQLPQSAEEDVYKQLTNYTSWLSPDRPLTINGNARFAGIDNRSSSTNGYSIRQTSANIGLGATYQQTREINTYANIGLNVTDDKNNGIQTMNSYETAGADYIEELYSRGPYNYGLRSSGSFSNSTGAPNSTQTIGLSLGHHLNRFTTDSSQIRVTTDLDQTVTANKATRTEPFVNLSHSGSLQWEFGRAGGTTALRFSASDVRALTGIENFYQLVNLQLNSLETMTRNSSFNGDLTIQATRQGIGGARATSTTTNGGINYSHQRVFSIPRLDFFSELRIFGNALPITTGAQIPASRSWTNNLGYTVGLVETLVQAIFEEYNNINQTTYLFRVRRIF